MSGTEGRRRLEPRMSRGSWKFAVLVYSLMTLGSGLLALNTLGSNGGWDVLSFWVFTAWFIVNVIQMLHLLRVRRNDTPFWDEDEARRADWDRRGRML